MILSSSILLLTSIVLLIGAVFGGSVANALTEDPFKNIGSVHNEIFPVGFSDKIRILHPYSTMKN
jgi:hypothetical protein